MTTLHVLIFGHINLEYRDLSKRQETAIYEPNIAVDPFVKLSVAILEQAQRDVEFLEKIEQQNENNKTYVRCNYLLSCIEPSAFLKNKNNAARMYLEAKNIKTDCIDNWLKNRKKNK